VTWIVDLSESMSGWIALDDGERQPLKLQLTASAPLWSRPTAPRPFTGTVSLGAAQETLPAKGTLTLLPAGPVYDFSFTSAHLGHLRCAGRKRYSLRGLKESLITCPLRVYREQACIGSGEIRYREPISRFALTSFRLRHVPAGGAAAAESVNAPGQSG
jgi:hypothetical protein